MTGAPATGAIVWFTGLPAAGKTTLARRVRDALPTPSVLLDSDEVRRALGAESYARGDRDAFYRALGRLARLLAAQGLVVLVAATAPRRAHRAFAADAPRFLEVHVATPLATCAARDPKGLYAAAQAGHAPQLPGIGAVYEEPRAPGVVASGGEDAAARDAIVAWLTA